MNLEMFRKMPTHEWSDEMCAALLAYVDALAAQLAEAERERDRLQELLVDARIGIVENEVGEPFMRSLLDRLNVALAKRDRAAIDAALERQP